MRLACYGLVERDAGSVASANFLILEELAQRGHDLDFYAKADFVRPEPLFDYDNFNYHGVLLDDQVQLRRLIPSSLGEIVSRIADNWLYRQHLNSIQQKFKQRHDADPYDAVLFLGVEPQFATHDIPAVSWLQGPPQTEWQAIERLSEHIINLSGRWLYWKLKAFYTYKQRAQQRRIAQADHLICGSEWSRTKIIDFGVPADRVHALPYPFDLDLFAPNPHVESLHSGKRTFLWLGRIDPRKRLDLMLDAFRLLIEERKDVHLEIIGRLNYAKEYKRLIDTFPHPDHITYRDHIPRADVPSLMNAVDVVVQPSEDENFGSSVAEALCCGTPVILGPTNGTAEYCGEAAFRFDAYTPEALQQEMKASLHALEHHNEDIATHARQTAEEQFDVEKIISELESVFHPSALAPRSSILG